eukprot:359572-Chlamydomonas_euryale.AAC.6
MNRPTDQSSCSAPSSPHAPTRLRAHALFVLEISPHMPGRVTTADMNSAMFITSASRRNALQASKRNQCK